MQRRILPFTVVALVSICLGSIFQPLAYLQALAQQANCRTFKETGMMVCGKFLTYWQTHGGLAQQGFPISGEFQEKSDLNGQNYTVQYFERAVFELHPENQPPYDVLLSQLGTFQARQKYGYPPLFPGTPTPVLRTLRGHRDAVWSVVFSPDGQTLASGSSDTTIKLWRVSDGVGIRTLAGHTDSVTSVALSPDGQTLASGSLDKTIKLWRVSDGSLIRTLIGHTDQVNSVAFSPDGQTLASGSQDYTIKLWRVSNGSEIRSLDALTGWVWSVAFSPDGQTLASGAGYAIVLWRVSDGSEIRTLAGDTSWVRSVAFSPDGQTLASGSADKTIRLWRVPGGSLIRILNPHADAVADTVISVAFSPDGRTLASGSADLFPSLPPIVLWRVSDGSEIRTLDDGHNAGLLCLAFSPDGQTLASGGYGNTIKLWKVK